MKEDTEYLHNITQGKESLLTREIVQKIINFGVTQQQILRITYLLVLELEDRETMVDISHVIKKYMDNIKFEEKIDKNRLYIK